MNTETKTNEESETINENTKQQVKSRLISMLVLAVSVSVTSSVLFVLIIGQTLFGFFANENNESMKKLAKQLTDYIYSALQYLTFNSDERPFPYQTLNEEKEQVVSSAESSV